jgi:hypothetical protein
MSDDVVDITIFGDRRRKILDLQTGEMRDGGPVRLPSEPEQNLPARTKRWEKNGEKNDPGRRPDRTTTGKA